MYYIPPDWESQEGNEVHMTFSEHLVHLRESRGVTQKELAKALNISLHAYQRFEYGEQEPRLTPLIGIAKFHDITLDELVFPEE